MCHPQIAMQERAQQQLLADTRAQWQRELADMKQEVAQRRTMLAAQVRWDCDMMYMCDLVAIIVTADSRIQWCG